MMPSMQIQLKQLKSHLQKSLAKAYLIHGDEPLLMQESVDAILAAAKQQGYNERRRFDVEPGFDWQMLVQEAEAMSLFSDKSVLQVYNPDAKFDDKASKALARYFEINQSDKILLITAGRIANNRQSTKWFKALDKNGIMLSIWPPSGGQLIGFLRERCLAAKLKVSAEAIELLAKLSEGNLLAAQQTITKLDLLKPSGEIDASLMARMLGDSAKYSVFDLSNATLQGQAAQASRILQSLRNTDTELVLVLWALQRDLAAIIALKQQPGNSYPSRNPQLQAQQSAAKRLNASQLKTAVHLASECDLIIKGLKGGDAWRALSNLCLLLAGVSLPKAILCNTLS